MARKNLNQGAIVQGALAATALIAFFGAISVLLLPQTKAEADMRLNPPSKVLKEGEEMVLEVVVEANTPTNVFAAELVFDPEFFGVEKIDYNTSIADLWAERPWYSNGDGTLNFAGGTTRRGGFTGEGTLLTITLKTKRAGAGKVLLQEVHVLKHDGFGTEATLEKTVNGDFAIFPKEQDLTAEAKPSGAEIVIAPSDANFDLNGDDRVTWADASRLFFRLGSEDVRYDLNGDGEVTNSDLTTLISAID